MKYLTAASIETILLCIAIIVYKANDEVSSPTKIKIKESVLTMNWKPATTNKYSAKYSAYLNSWNLNFDKLKKITKMIKEFGGLAHNMPVFAVVYCVILMASVGLPLTVGFIGEFLALLGFFKFSPLLTFIGALTIVLSAVYMLSMYKRTFFGNLVKEENKKLKDIFGRELVALGSLVVLIIALGIYPKIVLEPLNVSVTQLTKVMEIKAVNDDTKEKLRALNSIGEVK